MRDGVRMCVFLKSHDRQGRRVKRGGLEQGAEGGEEKVLLVVPTEVGGGGGEDLLAGVGRDGAPTLEGGIDVGGQTQEVKAVGFPFLLRGAGFGEVACAVLGQDAGYFGEVGGEDGDTGLGKVGYAVGERIAVVEAEVFEQAKAEVGLGGEGMKAVGLETAEKLYAVAPVEGGGILAEGCVEVAHACHHKLALGQVLHCVDQLAHSPTHVDGSLVEQSIGGSEGGANLQRTYSGEREVADHGHVDAVAAVVDIGHALAYGEGRIDTGQAYPLHFAPHGLHPWTSYEFGDVGEEFVGIEAEAAAAQECGQCAGREGVGIVGPEGVGRGEEQFEKETHIVFGIEPHIALEEEPHAAYAVGTGREGRAVGQSAADEGDAVARLGEGAAGAVDTLVGDQVVGDGKDYSFHARSVDNRCNVGSDDFFFVSL